VTFERGWALEESKYDCKRLANEVPMSRDKLKRAIDSKEVCNGFIWRLVKDD
jgi:hypothetical protein